MLVVATVRVGKLQRQVMCTEKPTPKQTNLLFALSEHVGYIVSVDDLCHRLKIRPPVLAFHACMLRKKLALEWVLDAVSNVGYRLLYVGTPLLTAKNVVVHIPEEFRIRRRHHSTETLEKMSQAAVKRWSRPSFRRVRLIEDNVSV
jgi:hypothetical protein